MSADDYHPFVPKPHESKIAGPTARAHAEARTKSPRAQGLFGKWEEMFNEPFRGITTAGQAIPDLFAAQAGRRADAGDDRGGERAAGR